MPKVELVKLDPFTFLRLSIEQLAARNPHMLPPIMEGIKPMPSQESLIEFSRTRFDEKVLDSGTRWNHNLITLLICVASAVTPEGMFLCLENEDDYTFSFKSRANNKLNALWDYQQKQIAQVVTICEEEGILWQEWLSIAKLYIKLEQ